MREDNAKKISQLAFKERREWRSWLVENHDVTEKVWLIIQKKSSPNKSITYDEALEEALCFGWIDSLKRSKDNESYIQLFSIRKARSNWSDINKKKVVELEKAGLMTLSGFRAIETAKENGSWNSSDLVEKMIIPDDLEAAFSLYDKSKDNFLAFSKSIKKGILAWIYSAKRPATREKRVLETAQNAAENIAASSS